MNIVVRLRTTADAARIGEVTPPAALFIDAAAEITRLQADNCRWSKIADERSKENCALRQENERLLAALQAIMDSDGQFETMYAIAKRAAEQRADGEK